MSKRIVVIDGHPDGSDARFVHALAAAYQDAATQAGHQVRVLRLATMDFTWLRTDQEFQHGRAPDVILEAQDDINWCTHMVILYPLWLGAMPALLKAFFEQVMRPGFTFGAAGKNKLPKKLLAGKSARIVVTMGMPALVYRWYFRAHSLKNLERNILRFTGFAPVRASIVGSVQAMTAKKRNAWLQRVRQLGVNGI